MIDFLKNLNFLGCFKISSILFIMVIELSGVQFGLKSYE